MKSMISLFIVSAVLITNSAFASASFSPWPPVGSSPAKHAAAACNQGSNNVGQNCGDKK